MHCPNRPVACQDGKIATSVSLLLATCLQPSLGYACDDMSLHEGFRLATKRQRAMGRRNLGSQLGAGYVSALAMLCTRAATFGQCERYQVEIIPGPNCQFVPSNAGALAISESGEMSGGYADCGGFGHGAV